MGRTMRAAASAVAVVLAIATSPLATSPTITPSRASTRSMSWTVRPMRNSAQMTSTTVSAIAPVVSSRQPNICPRIQSRHAPTMTAHPMGRITAATARTPRQARPSR